eukprot:TRINITY_DN2142_c0_g1_i4.p1 TRINITY_DN2142_c0_g1~~TRINITY_DN2142_c0_g1_i4.p1  ORF type:complete len:341 (+),score=79.22 TRINITY_DN2142_c0_g1_i4:111-1133(+)
MKYLKMLPASDSIGGSMYVSRGIRNAASLKNPKGLLPMQRRSIQRKIITSCTLQGISYGVSAVQGTGRPEMEDTYCIAVEPIDSEPAFFGVFDGHGGVAVAEMLKSQLWPVYKKKLIGTDPVKATIAAYEEVDEIALAQPKGLFGALRERGLGGSRCGATAATVVLQPSTDSQRMILAANVGDARIIISQEGQAVQLSYDHKPEIEEERKRIEAKNPFRKKPLVVNVGGTWRVGGVLALSRAFGDAYLKSSLKGTQGGYGLTAEPTVKMEPISDEVDFIVLGTDGLWEKMTNQEVIDFCLSNAVSKTMDVVANELVRAAQTKGATDDIAVVIVRPLKGQA